MSAVMMMSMQPYLVSLKAVNTPKTKRMYNHTHKALPKDNANVMTMIMLSRQRHLNDSIQELYNLIKLPVPHKTSLHIVF